MNKLKNKAQDFLSRLKKQAKEESTELAKHTASQVTGEDVHKDDSKNDDQKSSVIVEAMQSDKPEPTDEEKVLIQRKHIQRLKGMEDELEKFRQLRKRLDEQRLEEFDKKVGKVSEPGAPIEKPFTVPKSRPSRRLGAGQKGANIETRKSKQ